ncbi:MAG: PepSY-like domain-containing protein [Gemmataceae bacterium]
MMKISRFFLLASLFALFLNAGQAAPVPLEDAPKAVVDAVKTKYPSAEIASLNTEKEDDLDVINLTFKLDKGEVGVYEAEFTPEGKFVEHKERIAAADLPKTITDVVSKQFPDATFTLIQRKTKGEGADAVIEYIHAALDLKEGSAKLSINGDGEITSLSSEQAIAASDVPADVKAGLSKRYPDASVTAAEKHTSGVGDKAATVYKLTINTGGEERVLQFDPQAVLLYEKLTKRASN